ncbi:hypothetical protein [Haloarcula salina]|uniref:Uncharacterized protein n=1 Tax=Haloarcula salina TaxID=1429914 RepID=A0AA41FZJ9_9EURY|nr:hypothetical protein [Haloarcula salina]MBV0901655.1 hypothetical protein [Haloarcula salina]
MVRRALLAVLVLAGGAYAGTLRLGVVAPPSLSVGALVDAIGRLPREALLVGGAVLGLVTAGAVLWLAATLGYRLFRLGARLAPGGPSSPKAVFAVGSVVLLAVCFGSMLLVLGGTGSMWDSDAGATGVASDVQRAGMSSSIGAAVEGDTVAPASLSNATGRCSRPTGVDSDGDRLPDAWERNESTPDGAPLPDADPDRKDVYVQPIYAAGAERFTATEKAQLRRVWDEMPVSNPGGETGIALHFVDRVPDGGRMESPIAIANDLQPVRDRYYTRETMGAGRCRYHLVAVGTVAGDSLAGYGDRPGFVSIVDAERVPAYNGSVTFRVAVTTHELLHNTAGLVGGQSHPGSGWLGTGGEYLGNETKRDLDDGFAPPRAYWGR